MFHGLLLKYGAVAAAEPDIPAVTAVVSLSAEQEETMPLEQLLSVLVGNIQYVPADRGPALNHIYVMQVWDVVVL
jgi:hypothetical protein